MLALISCLFYTCKNEGGIDLRPFYFPVEALAEQPLVYEYQPVNEKDSMGAEYWYFQTLQTDTATYFTGNYYNQALIVGQFSSEEIVDNGSIQHDYFIYDYDSLGNAIRYDAKIEYGNVFPFQVKDTTSILLQKMTWTFREAPLIATTVIKNRRYIGEAQYDFNGQTYDCVKFEVREIIDNNSAEDGHLENEATSIEYYAKGLGLIYYRKVFAGGGQVLEYALKDTYTMQQLEKRYEAMYQ